MNLKFFPRIMETEREYCATQDFLSMINKLGVQEAEHLHYKVYRKCDGVFGRCMDCNEFNVSCKCLPYGLEEDWHDDRDEEKHWEKMERFDRGRGK